MVGSFDVETLLTTGTWTTQRAKCPASPNPVRANHHSRRPPPPSVEDESASVAKEQGGHVVAVTDEEPKCKGDVDQNPIILPVFEFNPERRYVLVTPSETEDGFVSDSLPEKRPRPAPRAEYPANTKIQLDRKADEMARPGIQRRKSRADLPRIETDVPYTRPKTPSNLQPARSATWAERKPRESRDYFSPHPESARAVADSYLSPIITHATKGRERAYWNFNAGSEGTSHRGSTAGFRPNPASPAAQRRTHSAVDVPREPKRTEERHSSYRTDSSVRTRRYDELSPTLDQRQVPPRSTRREPSQDRSHSQQPKLSRRKSSYTNRPYVPRDDSYGYSSDEDPEYRRPRTHHNRRRSTVIQDDRPTLLSPRSAPVSKAKSRPSSPLPSPKSSQANVSDYDYQGNPRTSTTAFSSARTGRRNGTERPVSPISSGDSSPRSGPRLTAGGSGNRPRAASRTPSVRSNTGISKPGTTSAPLSVPTPQAMPPSPAYSHQGCLEAIYDPRDYWQPELFNPDQHHGPPRNSANNTEQLSVVSYRRYSEQVSAGVIPGLPDCPMKRPCAGYTDWVTLSRSDNFTICLPCYEQVFSRTEFRHLFVKAPYRSREKETSCDFGTSPWYRIAWLMTCKYRRNDLRLVRGVADVLSKEKVPCYGSTHVTRMWYSVTDPESQRCIPGFRVCSPCARAVETLFPSLTGVFVPKDRQPKHGRCSLHSAPNRTRFLTYFDMFEKCHDEAMRTKSAPSIRRLADNISFWAEVEECPQDEPRRNEEWYMMASVPELTACLDCFLHVVYPELVADVEAQTAAGSERRSPARDFYQKPVTVETSTVCQMASPKMREIFRRACRRDDGIEYLDDQVRKRLDAC